MKKTAVLAVMVFLVIAAFGMAEAAPALNGVAPVPDGILATVGSGGKAVPATGADFKAAPVFNARGEVVADPSGSLATGGRSAGPTAARLGSGFTVAPRFDTNGAIVSDPTGTMVGAQGSGTRVVPAIAANFKVAPVFDARGALVSDPSGALSGQMFAMSQTH